MCETTFEQFCNRNTCFKGYLYLHKTFSDIHKTLAKTENEDLHLDVLKIVSLQLQRLHLYRYIVKNAQVQKLL